MTTMTKRDCRNRNLIYDEGFFSPFVARGDDGLIYVGDCDNIDSFSTVAQALMHCNCSILSGDELDRAERAYKKRYRNNAAAEYQWHCDAELQRDALLNLLPRL